MRALLGLGPWPHSDDDVAQPPVGWEVGGRWGLGTARSLPQLHARMGLRVVATDDDGGGGDQAGAQGGGQGRGRGIVCLGVEEQAWSGWLPRQVMY